MISTSLLVISMRNFENETKLLLWFSALNKVTQLEFDTSLK